MVNISVDEAYALDYLSILIVKGDKTKPQQTKIEDVLALSFGSDKFFSIISSDEFRALTKANKNIFLAIEAIQNGNSTMSGKELNNLNKERFKFKTRIQQKFFDTKPTEIKI